MQKFFRKKFDQLPKNHFALVFSSGGYTESFPFKTTRFDIRILIFTIAVLFILHDSGTSVLRPDGGLSAFHVLAACLVARVFFWLFFRVFRVAKDSLETEVFVHRLDKFCNRLMILLVLVVVHVSSFGSSIEKTVQIYLAAFIAVEVIANIIMFTCIPKRIVAGAYCSRSAEECDGNGSKSWVSGLKDVAFGIAVIPLIVYFLADRVGDMVSPRDNPVREYVKNLYFGLPDPAKYAVFAFLILVFASLVLIEAKENVLQNVVVYYFDRFEKKEPDSDSGEPAAETEDNTQQPE